MWIFISIVAILCITFWVIGDIQEKKKKKGNPEPENKTDKIKTVQLLGTRTGEETRVLATYNFTLYSFLVIYESGKREVVECKNGSDDFNELIKYIKVKNETDEVEIFETIDD